MKKCLDTYKRLENKMIYKIKEFAIEYKQVFFVTLFIGIIIHLFVLTNKLLNWDEIGFLFSKGNSYTLGRWLLDSTRYIFPNISLPAFNGIISLILLSVSSVFIIDILEIKSKLNRILVGEILVSFPSIISTFTYMFTSHAYMLSLLMAVLSVYFAKKKKGKLPFILSIILLTLSLGIYQAYISFAATILIILLIKQCFEEKDYKQILKQSVKFILILIISLILYAVINKVIIKVLGVTLTEYQGASSMGNYTFKGIIDGIIKTYKHIFIPFWGVNAITPNTALRIIYVVCLILNILYVIIEALKNKSQKINSCLAIIFMLLLPMAFNSVYILNPGNTDYHCLMMYADCFIYISLILIIENNKKYLTRIIKLLLIAQIFFCMYIANMAYLKLHLSYENAYSFYTGVITRIESVEGYNENSKILMTGAYRSKELYQTNKFGGIDKLTGAASNEQLINSYTRLDFIKYYIGFNGEFISDTNITNQILTSEEYKEMPIYPYDGSVKKIDDVVVVKLSE